MQKLKLSAVCSALVVAGIIPVSAQAAICEPQFNSNVSQCEITTEENGEVGISLNDVKGISIIDTQSTTKGDGAYALYAKNSELVVNNGTFSTYGKSDDRKNRYSDVVAGENAMFQIVNSTITAHNSPSRILYLRDSTATIKDSNLIATEGRAIEIKDTKLDLQNVKMVMNGNFGALISSANSEITANNLNAELGKGEKTFFSLEENEKVTLVNSTLKSARYGFSVYGYKYSDTPELEKGKVEQLITLDNTELSMAYFFLRSDSIGYQYNTQPAKYRYTVFNVNATNNSKLIFSSYFLPNAEINLTLSDSTFTFTDTTNLNNLILNNGEVNSGKDDYRKLLYIRNDLSGTGTFTLNTYLAREIADEIIVKGKDSGEFGLNIQDSGDEPKAPNGKATVVQTQTGKANFKLLGKDYVDAGAYRYRLVKVGNNWLLSNNGEQSEIQPNQPDEKEENIEMANEAVENTIIPVLPVVAESVTSPQPQPQPQLQQPQPQKALSEKTNALVSLRQAQLLSIDNDLSGIHQRLGEVKGDENGNVWVRNINSRHQFASTATASDSMSSGFHQNTHSVQVGADTAISPTFRLGGVVSTSNANLDFNQEYGTGKMKSQGLGLYGALLLENGFYWDNIIKYDHLKAQSLKTDKRHYNAYTLSTEVGRLYRLNKGWTITPQLQGSWTNITRKADETRLSALTGRVGVRVTKSFNFVGWTLQPYAEINGAITQNNTAYVRVNQHQFKVASSGKRLETAVGLNAMFGNHKVGIEGKVTKGKFLDQPYAIQAVYRYSW